MNHVKMGYDIVVFARTAQGDGEPMVGKCLKVCETPGCIDAVAFQLNDPGMSPYFKNICHADHVSAPADGTVFVWRGLSAQWDIDEQVRLEIFPANSLGAGLPVLGELANTVAPGWNEVDPQRADVGSVSDTPKVDPNAGTSLPPPPPANPEGDKGAPV